MEGYTALAQRKAIRREFEEAIEDRAWPLAARIWHANKDLFTDEDFKRAWDGCHR
jgi:hypothetical protein